MGGERGGGQPEPRPRAGRARGRRAPREPLALAALRPPSAASLQKTTDAEVEAAVDRARAADDAVAERRAAAAAAVAEGGGATADAPRLLRGSSSAALPVVLARAASVRTIVASGGKLQPLQPQQQPAATAAALPAQLAVSVKGPAPVGWGSTVSDRLVLPAGPPAMPQGGDFLCARCNASVAGVLAQEEAAAAAARARNPFGAGRVR